MTGCLHILPLLGQEDNWKFACRPKLSIDWELATSLLIKTELQDVENSLTNKISQDFGAVMNKIQNVSSLERSKQNAMASDMTDEIEKVTRDMEKVVKYYYIVT